VANPQRTILIIEDNEDNRLIYSTYLTFSGYRVLEAVDGERGISMTRSELPDLVLMDVSLPHTDGWTATKILKSDPATAHIPIIALTAHAMSGDREKTLQAGCDDYDTKPIELARLLGKIEALLGRQASA
jgi:CheY-like chemotaxis protein